MGKLTIDGESPVSETVYDWAGILSRPGQEKSRLNYPAPSGKAKYS